MKCYCRGYRTFIVETLGLRRRRSPVQTVLILLVESGLVYLVFQVSDCVSCSLICEHKILHVLTVLTAGVPVL